MYNIQEEEDAAFTFATPGEVDRFDTELGAFNNNNTTQAWILSGRDVWYPNPYYTGAPQCHPECPCWDEAGAENCAARVVAPSPRKDPEPFDLF